jgi:heat shock protein HtpX
MGLNATLTGRTEKIAAVETTAGGVVALGVVTGVVAVCCDLLWGHSGILLELGVAVLALGGAWWFSDGIVIRSSGAHLLRGHAASELKTMLDELAGRAGLPVPRLYVVPNPQPNAFAIGRTQRHAAIVVTEGLLSLLEASEIRAILAHEMAHIRRRDTRLTSLAGATASAIFSVAELAGRLGRRSVSRRREGSKTVVDSVTPFVAGLLNLALSGRRESGADREGSELTGDPAALARALTRIERYAVVVPMDVTLAYTSAWVVDPIGDRAEGASPLSRYPTIADRVECLAVFPARRVAT